jgi:hypothetical protein
MKNLERLIKTLAEDIDANKMSKDESDRLLKDLGNELARRNYVSSAVVSEEMESKYNINFEEFIDMLCFKINRLEDSNSYLHNKLNMLEEAHKSNTEQLQRNIITENNRLHEQMMNIRSSDFYESEFHEPEPHHKKGFIESLFSSKKKK